MNEVTFRRELLEKLERIAKALELQNEADPLLAIQAALGMTPTKQLVDGQGNAEINVHVPGAVSLEEIERNLAAYQRTIRAAQDDYIPPAQRRAMGLE